MTALLAIIYVSFISLGLPDSLLGAAWPSMYGALGVPVSSAGVISMIVSGGTIVSSLLSDRMIRKFGTGLVTAISVSLTAAALLLFSVSRSFYLLCALAVPLGLGAGSVDAALNNFVALHYKARHMSWLHCFWGVGATVGPMIMGLMLSGSGGWAMGYRVIGLIQTALVAALFLTLPLWRRAQGADEAEKTQEAKHLSPRELLALPGAKAAVAAFFVYCSVESTLGLWSASFLVFARGVAGDTAARWVSLNYLGITAGRFLSGFLTMRLNQRRMIRLGQGVMALGIATLFFARTPFFLAAGLFLTGLGCAPIFPSLLHETPLNFGAAHSQQIMGVQMACAYVGTTLTPPLVGLVVSAVSYDLMPLFLLLFCLSSVVLVEILNRQVDKGRCTNLPR